MQDFDIHGRLDIGGHGKDKVQSSMDFRELETAMTLMEMSGGSLGDKMPSRNPTIVKRRSKNPTLRDG